MTVDELDAAARAAMDRGALAEAEALLRQALARNPGSLPVRTNLAACLALQGRTGEAEALLCDVLQADPDYLFPRALLATLLAQAGRLEEAAAEAARALRQALASPPAPEAADQLVSALALLDDDAGLRKLHERLASIAASLAPETLHALTLAARRAGVSGGPFEETLRRHPAAAYEPFAGDLARLDQGRVGALVYLHRRLLAEKLMREADDLAQSGRLPEAERRYRHVLELVPQAVWARVNLSTLYRAVGRLAEAQALLEEAAGLDDHPGIRLNLAGVLVERGEWAEAEAMLDELEPGGLDRRLQVLHHLVRAEARSRAGLHDQALAAWEEAARLAPEAAEVARTRRELDRRREEAQVLQFLQVYQNRRRERLERAILRARAGHPVPPVRECLRVLTADNLRAVWTHYRQDAFPRRRSEALDRLAETIVQGLPQTLEGLAAEERALLEQIRAAGGMVPLEELARWLPEFRQDSWFWDRALPEGPAGRLRFLQLVGFGRLQPQAEPAAFLPLEVRELLR
ncbi:MAG TPA: tetratricopeptide repeat protein [Limnochorda sp.]